MKKKTENNKEICISCEKIIGEGCFDPLHCKINSHSIEIVKKQKKRWRLKN